VEVGEGSFLVGCWGFSFLAICNKHSEKVTKISMSSTDETQCTDLLLLPGFNPTSFPFALTRSNKGLGLVDLAK
jgi:hypothetical protein